MKCSKCGGKTKVLDGSFSPDEIYRKRGCKACGYKFYTIEYEIEKNENMWKEWTKYNRSWIRYHKKVCNGVEK